jgi:hypothetical protein
MVIIYEKLKNRKKINWKYVKHWLKCTIEDIPSYIWFVIRWHYIALISVCANLYIIFSKVFPVGLFSGDSFLWFIVAIMIFFLGLGYDMKKNQIMLY